MEREKEKVWRTFASTPRSDGGETGFKDAGGRSRWVRDPTHPNHPPLFSAIPCLPFCLSFSLLHVCVHQRSVRWDRRVLTDAHSVLAHLTGWYGTCHPDKRERKRERAERYVIKKTKAFPTNQGQTFFSFSLSCILRVDKMLAEWER